MHKLRCKLSPDFEENEKKRTAVFPKGPRETDTKKKISAALALRNAARRKAIDELRKNSVSDSSTIQIDNEDIGIS